MENTIKLFYKKIKLLKTYLGKSRVFKKILAVQNFIQLIYLGALLIYTIFLFTNEEEVFKGPFYQFKYVMVVVTGFMFICYFFSKALEKYFTKKEKEKINES